MLHFTGEDMRHGKGNNLLMVTQLRFTLDQSDSSDCVLNFVFIAFPS